MRLRMLWIALLCIVQSIQSQTVYPHGGKLIVIGGGDIPESIYDFFAQSIGGKDQSIVYIPTATEDEEWIQQGQHLIKFSSRGFTNLTTVHTRDRSKADLLQHIEAVRKAKGIFLGGGDQVNLANAYGGTQLHKEMIALLERGGVIMGTSAGATIMGSLLIGGDHRKTPQLPQQFPIGFSFMEQTAIDQHVLVRNRQFDLIPVLERNPGVWGMAIDESTAAVVMRDSIQVIGNSYLMVYDPKDWEKQKKEWGRVYKPFVMYRPGQTIPLISRKP